MATTPSRKKTPSTLPFYPVPMYSTDMESEYYRLYSKGNTIVEELKRAVIEQVEKALQREDDLTLVRDLYLDVNHYRLAGVGSVRAVYYRELALGHLYQELLEATPWGYREMERDVLPGDVVQGYCVRVGTSYFDACGVRLDREEWLLHDMLLAEMPASLGVPWAIIEEAMFTAFCAALPDQFRARYITSSDANIITYWHQAWTDWAIMKNNPNTHSSVRHHNPHSRAKVRRMIQACIEEGKPASTQLSPTEAQTQADSQALATI